MTDVATVETAAGGVRSARTLRPFERAAPPDRVCGDGPADDVTGAAACACGTGFEAGAFAASTGRASGKTHPVDGVVSFGVAASFVADGAVPFVADVALSFVADGALEKSHPEVCAPAGRANGIPSSVTMTMA
jgi:hypothetical protein